MNDLKELQSQFGGEFLNNQLKINRFCTIECIDYALKLTSIIYGMKNEIIGNKEKISQILVANI